MMWHSCMSREFPVVGAYYLDIDDSPTILIHQQCNKLSERKKQFVQLLKHNPSVRKCC
jgi:hypothetical protein